MFCKSDNHHLLLFTHPKENILVDDDDQPKLTGFISIKMQSSGRASRSSQGGGSSTIQWMSPELLKPDGFGLENRDPTTKSDCFALGMVIYEVLSGHVPFASSPPFVVPALILRGDRPERPEGSEGRWLTDEIWTILQLCWAEQPGDRPSAEDVLACLEESPLPQSPVWYIGEDAETDNAFTRYSNDPGATPMPHSTLIPQPIPLLPMPPQPTLPTPVPPQPTLPTPMFPRPSIHSLHVILG